MKMFWLYLVTVVLVFTLGDAFLMWLGGFDFTVRGQALYDAATHILWVGFFSAVFGSIIGAVVYTEFF